MKCGWVIAVAVLALLGCELDPCRSLQLKVCGSDAACADAPACSEARSMVGAEVRAACEAALENEESFPLCRQVRDAASD